jgi:hypothetical protein
LTECGRGNVNTLRCLVLLRLNALVTASQSSADESNSVDYAARIAGFTWGSDLVAAGLQFVLMSCRLPDTKRFWQFALLRHSINKFELENQLLIVCGLLCCRG